MRQQFHCLKCLFSMCALALAIDLYQELVCGEWRIFCVRANCLFAYNNDITVIIIIGYKIGDFEWQNSAPNPQEGTSHQGTCIKFLMD